MRIDIVWFPCWERLDPETSERRKGKEISLCWSKIKKTWNNPESKDHGLLPWIHHCKFLVFHLSVCIFGRLYRCIMLCIMLRIVLYRAEQSYGRSKWWSQGVLKKSASSKKEKNIELLWNKRTNLIFDLLLSGKNKIKNNRFPSFRFEPMHTPGYRPAVWLLYSVSKALLAWCMWHSSLIPLAVSPSVYTYFKKGCHRR